MVSEHLLKRVKVSLCSQKRELVSTRVPESESTLFKYRGFGVYSMKKTGGRRKLFTTRAIAAR
jgi:hypothetical protein